MSRAEKVNGRTTLRILIVGALVAGLLFLPLFHNHPLFRSGSNSGDLSANSHFCLFCALGLFVTALFVLLNGSALVANIVPSAELELSLVRIAARGSRAPPRL